MSVVSGLVAPGELGSHHRSELISLQCSTASPSSSRQPRWRATSFPQGTVGRSHGQELLGRPCSLQSRPQDSADLCSLISGVFCTPSPFCKCPGRLLRFSQTRLCVCGHTVWNAISTPHTPQFKAVSSENRPCFALVPPGQSGPLTQSLAQGCA